MRNMRDIAWYDIELCMDALLASRVAGPWMCVHTRHVSLKQPVLTQGLPLPEALLDNLARPV